MTAIKTNRDLYLAVSELTSNQADSKGSLEEYLRALREISKNYRERTFLIPDEFLDVLSTAFNGPIPLWNKSWSTSELPDSAIRKGFENWDSTILRQIVDLREMEERGILNNEYRYFGVQAPCGGTWYNFDPWTYLECATAGSFGGWREGDETGRILVPGEVAVIDAEGKLTSCDPMEIPEKLYAVPSVSWDAFDFFLEQGQGYE